MGGLERVGPTDWVPWVGGKPNMPWTGLQNPPTSVEPQQFRPQSVGSSSKAKHYRTNGLEKKFSRKDDLLTFQRQVMKHLEDYGMDTITYLEDPQSSNEMVSVISDHAKFSRSTAKADESTRIGLYDRYDQSNMKDAKEFLMDSLDPSLEKLMYERVPPNGTFIEHWMELMHMVRPVSVEQFEKIKTTLRARSIKDYPGENVENMASDYITDWIELDGAGMYDHKLTRVMISKIMEGGGDNNEDFRSDLRVTKNKLSAKILEIRHLPYEEQNREIAQADLDVRSVLNQAKDKYDEVLADGNWPAAAHATDSKALKKGYGHSVNQVAVNALRQVLGMSSGSSKTTEGCFRCGSKDHWLKDCPKPPPPKENGRKKFGKKPFVNPKKDKMVRGNRRARNGPFPPPKEGESETKTSNGKTFHYCKKCSRWNLSHTTSQHKGKEDLKPKVGMTRVNFDLHPSAFRAHIDPKYLNKMGQFNDESIYCKPVQKNSSFAKLFGLLAFGLFVSYIAMNTLTIKVDWSTLYDKILPEVVLANRVLTSFIEWSCIRGSYMLAFAYNLMMFTANLISQIPSEMKLFDTTLGLAVGSVGTYVLGKVILSIDPDYISPQDRTRWRKGDKYRTKCTRQARKSLRRKRFRTKRAMTANDIKNCSDPYLFDFEQHGSIDSGPKQWGKFCKHHVRYSHVPRTKRMKLPGETLIRYLERRIHEVKCAIKELQRELKQLEQQLREAKQKQHKEKQPKVKRSKKSKLPKHLRKYTFALAVAQCVDASSITSTGDGNYTYQVLFDSGANCCITSYPSDFVGPWQQFDKGPKIDGIGQSLMAKGSGHVAWTFTASNGMLRTLKLPCLYVPDYDGRIASIKRILHEYPNEDVKITKDKLILSGDKKNNQPSINVPFCHKTQLPMASGVSSMDSNQPNQFDNNQDEEWHLVGPKSYRGSQRAKRSVSKNKNPLAKIPGSTSVTEPSNYNLTGAEKELLKWHYRLGHIGMKRVQWLMRQGLLSTSIKGKRLHEEASKLTQGPLCTACQYAKQRRKSQPGTTKKENKDQSGAMKVDKLFPGQQVSVDHFVCNPKGRLLHTYGKESNSEKYCGGCIYVDHGTGLIHVELQQHFNSHQTLESTKNFEKMAGDYGVVIQSYVSDNGSSFTSQEYANWLADFKKDVKHSGVGAHHSNGIAERNIGYVLPIARAMMHHSAIHWPDVADAQLWPLAVQHAVHILNRIPREDSGLSPLELFTRKTWSRDKFHQFHVWGSPAYVLDATIADGKKLPRWKPRSARTQYVGLSTKHSGQVPLVMSLETGKITSQFNVVHDDWFATVTSSNEELPNFDDDEWYHTFGLSPNQYIQDDHEDDLPVSNSQGSIQPVSQQQRTTEEEALQQREKVALQQHILSDDGPEVPKSSIQRETEPVERTLPVPSPTPTPEKIVVETIPEKETQAVSGAKWFDVEEAPPQPSSQREKIPTKESTSTPSLRRSQRTRNQPEFYTSYTGVYSGQPTQYWNDKTFDLLNHVAKLCMEPVDFYETMPAALKAKAKSDPDTYNWDEAMRSPYVNEFLESALEEIESLVKHNTWEEVPKCTATGKIIPSQWVFRIKRSPDGEIRKFKGRCVLRGDQQEYDGETYSPVASWSTVRAFVVMCHKYDWFTCCIDYSNAFVQSPLPEDQPVWMHLPRGFKSSKGPDYCLRLKKSLYGHVVAPRLWFEYATKAFREMGLIQSKHDPCLWYGKNLMIVVYVDDCGLGAPTQKIMDDFVKELQKRGFHFTQEGSFAEFLGIKFDQLKDGSIELTQKGLITKILAATKMEDCNPNSLPAPGAAVGTDADGEPMKESFNYRAIIGMCLYLSTNTRPDITFAVSQLARFSNSPKQSHSSALKTLVRYLKKTRDKGMIIKPTNRFTLDLHVDADFCGLFKREDDLDPNVARSRSGWIISLCGCPLVWKSQLMAHITQSTTEAEYSALTTSLRTFLPLKKLVEEMVTNMGDQTLQDTTVHASVFEDNQSAYYLATNQRVTNRTKYFLAKWHWFWECYRNKEFQIYKCPTDEQDADYLTKMLSKDLFEKNRSRVQGW